MARHVDPQNFYFLSLRSSNTVSLRKVVDGTVSILRSAPFAVQPGTWYQLRLDAIGNRLRAYVNGVLLLETTDQSIASGNAGPAMFKAATDYDDFAAYQP
jgi:ABC-type amino acid transport system permease subunit